MENIQQNPASDNQKADVVAFFAGLAMRLSKTDIQAVKILHNKKALTKKIVEWVGEISVESEYVNAYKKDIERFFFEVYGQTHDLSGMAFKEVWAHFMVNPGNLSSDTIYNDGFRKLGISASKYISDSIDAKRSGGKSAEQSRPAGLYAFGHVGGDEPDTVHLGRSYDQFSVDGKTYLTINEYMLVYQFMYWKFKIRLDKKGWTRTSNLDSDGKVMFGDSNCDWFRLYWDDRVGQVSGDGPREAEVF